PAGANFQYIQPSRQKCSSRTRTLAANSSSSFFSSAYNSHKPRDSDRASSPRATSSLPDSRDLTVVFRVPSASWNRDLMKCSPGGMGSKADGVAGRGEEKMVRATINRPAPVVMSSQFNIQ